MRDLVVFMIQFLQNMLLCVYFRKTTYRFNTSAVFLIMWGLQCARLKYKNRKHSCNPNYFSNNNSIVQFMCTQVLGLQTRRHVARKFTSPSRRVLIVVLCARWRTSIDNFILVLLLEARRTKTALFCLWQNITMQKHTIMLFIYRSTVISIS